MKRKELEEFAKAMGAKIVASFPSSEAAIAFGMNRLSKRESESWFVYVVRCSDGTLYTGITTDLQNRIAAHNSGKGAKYIVPSRRPCVLVWHEKAASKSAALIREAAIKKMKKADKEALTKSSNTSHIA
jgi:putative endonuclease